MPVPTIWLSTLGCAKNQVDSEKLVAMFSEAGYGWADKPEHADVLMVNTCTFIEEAREESVEIRPELEVRSGPGSARWSWSPRTWRHLAAIQEELTEVGNARWVGRTDRVLVDQVEDDVPLARSHRQAPEIDGVIRLDQGRPGEWVTMEYTVSSAPTWGRALSTPGRSG